MKVKNSCGLLPKEEEKKIAFLIFFVVYWLEEYIMK